MRPPTYDEIDHQQQHSPLVARDIQHALKYCFFTFIALFFFSFTYSYLNDSLVRYDKIKRICMIINRNDLASCIDYDDDILLLKHLKDTECIDS